MRVNDKGDLSGIYMGWWGLQTPIPSPSYCCVPQRRLGLILDYRMGKSCCKRANLVPKINWIPAKIRISLFSASLADNILLFHATVIGICFSIRCSGLCVYQRFPSASIHAAVLLNRHF